MVREILEHVDAEEDERFGDARGDELPQALSTPGPPAVAARRVPGRSGSRAQHKRLSAFDPSSGPTRQARAHHATQARQPGQAIPAHPLPIGAPALQTAVVACPLRTTPAG